MAVRTRDVSRSRKAYSYFRPRPRLIYMAEEEEMNTIQETMNAAQATMNTVAGLSSIVNTLQNSVNNQIVWNETPSGSIDGMNVNFTIENTPLENKILVFVNGVLQEKENDADYQLNDKTITFNYPPVVDSKILVTYTKAI